MNAPTPSASRAAGPGWGSDCAPAGRLQQALLLRLARAPASAAELAAALDLPPAPTHTLLERLRAAGAPLACGEDGAWRLAPGFEPLDEARIAAALGAGGLVEVTAETDSTNLDALRRPWPDGAAWCLLLAERQRAGRGRAGRRWTAGFGGGLALTLALPAPADAPPPGLAAALAVAVLESLHAEGVTGLALHWPNDIWAGAGKLAGLLVECGGRAPRRLVVGLGVNVTHAPRLDRPTAALAELGWRGSRNTLASRLADALREAVARHAEAGFAPFRAAYLRHDALLGRPLRLNTARGSIAGRGAGLDAEGRLRLDTPTGRLALADGEVEKLDAGG